jgi:S-disulfanyl-L-cysteine oxidoreductase SoxD
MFSSLDRSKHLFERRVRKSSAENAEKTSDSYLASSAPFANPLRTLRSKKLGLGVVLAAATVVAPAQTRFDGIGRAATPAEIKAWDIDVRPDFKGLPKGQGSVAQGEKLWAAQCASCHGDFGESNEVFTPIAGGTTAADVQTGRVAALLPGTNTPQRTTLMKLSSLSTLWDYINRAMPWTAPKSLSSDEVYALSAYILNLGNIVPASFVLSDQNIRDVQAKLPNRNGKTTDHAMWPGTDFKGPARPDAQGSNCMSNCQAEPKVASLLPDYARDAHGNLAAQSRGIGGTRGANTLRASAPAPKSDEKVAAAGVNASQAATNSVAKPDALMLADVNPIMQKTACMACHGLDNKLVGPSFAEIAKKYAAQADGVNYLAGKIKNGGQGVWGSIPMPAQTVSEEEATRVAQWLAQGAKK